MKHTQEYRIIEGNKEDFEKELDQLTNDEWNIFGNMNTMPTREGMHYSLLVQKVTTEQ